MGKKPTAAQATSGRWSAEELPRDEPIYNIKELEYEIGSICNL
jgi:hypothetical protein